MPRKQDENLIPFDSSQNREEAAKNGKKGGIASGKARREKKALRETMQELLTMKLKDKKLLEELAALGFTAKGITMQDAISAAMIKQAVKGNVKAYNAIKDTLAEKSEEKTDNSVTEIVIVPEDASEADDEAGD